MKRERGDVRGVTFEGNDLEMLYHELDHSKAKCTRTGVEEELAIS
jgi:hypothetical protein